MLTITTNRWYVGLVALLLLGACGSQEGTNVSNVPEHPVEVKVKGPKFLKAERIEIDGINYLCIIADEYSGHDSGLGVWCEKSDGNPKLQ